jgi:curved DNA-binding protein CbpA
VKSPYEILGVPLDAPPELIKAHYRLLAKDLHPDLHPDDAEGVARMSELAGAYEVLSDPAKRKRYDETGMTDEPPNEIEQQALIRFSVVATEIFFQREDINAAMAIAQKRSAVEMQIAQQISELAKKRSILEAAANRITRRPDRDILGGIIASELAKIAASEKQLELERKVSARVWELFADYEFSEPAVATVAGYWLNCGGQLTWVNA